MPNAKPDSDRHPFFDNALFLFAFVAVFWGVEVVDALITGWDLDQYGVRPREKSGLLGIFAAPFLHGNFPHLIGNTIPFIALGGLVLLSGRDHFVLVSLIVTVVAGLGIWLFARSNSVHIGASSLIFGYLGFLLLRAWFGRDLRWGAIALLAAFLYGGLVLTLFRHQPGISWHGHAFGFLGGGLAAWLLTADKGRAPRKAPVEL